jgi:UDP-glucose 4-epimerase
VTLKFTGGLNGGIGWKGDIKEILLDPSKLQTMGWRSKLSSRDAVTRILMESAAELNLKKVILTHN